MRLIHLEKTSLNKDWSKQFVDEENYDVLYNEDVTIYKPDGQPLLCLLKKSLNKEKVADAWKILKDLNPVTENRSTASGIEAVPRKKLNGELSKVTRVPKGWEVISGIVGYFERTPRIPYCHACAWNLQNPEKFSVLLPMVQEVNSLFEKHIPDRYAVQKSYVDKTASDFVIPGTVFTTLTINKNFRTACHIDAGDLEAGFSCLSVIRKGKYKGGDLVLPNWRIAVQLDTFDLVMFDAHEYHGNTQIIPLTPDATRCSLVYYYREKMVHCKTAKEELEFAKNKKFGEPLK